MPAETPDADLSWLPEMTRVAVIGPSKKRNYFFLRAHVTQFKGAVVAIKPGTTRIPEFPDLPVYASIVDVPDPVDFAFVAVPREHVHGVLEQCLQKGVRLVTIFSAEFSDAGTPEGRHLEEALRALLERHHYATRVLGPNGMGLYYPKRGLAWRPRYPKNPGHVTLIFQSGGLSNLFIHTAGYRALPLGKVFSFGNGLDLDFVALLEFAARDPETGVIGGYLEGIRPGQGARLRAVLQACEKPVLVLKGGRSSAGQTAAQTHTASLAGARRAWETLLRQHNVVVAEDFDDLVNLVAFFHCYADLVQASLPLQRACIISLSGGFGVVATDVFELAGFTVPPFSPAVQARLDELIAISGTSARNPVDLSMLITRPPVIREAVAAILEDPGIDLVYFELPTWYFDQSHQVYPDPDFMAKIVDIFAMGPRQGKVLVASIPHVGFSALRQEALARCTAKGIPVFTGARDVVRVLTKVRGWLDRRQRR